MSDRKRQRRQVKLPATPEEVARASFAAVPPPDPSKAAAQRIQGLVVDAAILALLSVLVPTVGYLVRRIHRLEERINDAHVDLLKAIGTHGERIATLEGAAGVTRAADTADAPVATAPATT